jgi:WD40 repeat protein
MTSISHRPVITRALRGSFAIAILGAGLLAIAIHFPLCIGAALAQGYQQSGDVTDSAYMSVDRAAVRAVKYSDTDAYNVEVWDLSANKKLSSIRGLSGVVNTANISPDGRKVVTAERTGIVGLWDAATGNEIRLLRGHGDQIQDARFSPDGAMIASGARDSTARTWDAETGAQIAVHQQKGGYYVDTVSFSPDGRWVLSAGNGWAEIWDARSGKVLQSTFVGPQEAGAFDTSARFSSDGKSIVVTDLDGKIINTIPVELPANTGSAPTAGAQH